MSFTARQLHCLDAMGLVAWTNGERSESSNLQTVQQPLVKANEPVVAKPALSDKSPDDISSASSQFVQWLVHQPLTPMTYKGTESQCIGPEQASLLVICLHVEADMTLPLSRDCAQLFDLMMRSIDIPRTGYRQCAMPANAHPGNGGVSATTYIDDIMTPQTRSLLVLDRAPTQNPDPPGMEQPMTWPSAVPVFRVPHPDLLLTTSALKRQAWESLKSLKRVLDAQVKR